MQIGVRTEAVVDKWPRCGFETHAASVQQAGAQWASRSMLLIVLFCALCARNCSLVLVAGFGRNFCCSFCCWLRLRGHLDA